MAIPTISGLSPNTGKPRGDDFVVISGTNFRPQDAADWGELPAQSVKVEFNGVACELDEIWVRSTGIIECRTPPTLSDTIPLGVDVTVTNIDDDGNPIAGETVTLTGGYTYAKPSLNQSSEVYETETEVVKKLVEYLKRNIPAAIVVSNNPDYKLTNSDPYPNEATEPAIYLAGPNWSRDLVGAQILGNFLIETGDYQKKQPEVFFFNFDIIGVTGKFRLTNNLASIFWDAIERAPEIEISYLGHSLYVRIEGVTEPNSFTAKSLKDGLEQFQAEIRLTGVPGHTDTIRKIYDTTPQLGEIVKWQK